MESSIDTPSSKREDSTRVARIQENQGEAKGRSMGSVEGVGEGIVVSTKRWGHVSGDPVAERNQRRFWTGDRRSRWK